MRLLFVHDHRFYRDAHGLRYTSGSMPTTAWDRYLRHFSEVHVLAREGGEVPLGTTPAVSSAAGVRFETTPSLSSFAQLVRPSKQSRRQIVDAVQQADAVVARVPSQLGLMAAKTARRLGKPYALEVVGCAWDGYFNHGSLAARFYAPLAFLQLRALTRDAPLALYVTSSWLQQRYPTAGFSAAASNVEILPLDDKAVAGRAERLAALGRGRTPTVGTVASLAVAYKGLQTAFAALARLRTSGLEIRYSILGPGDPAPWRKLAQKLGVGDLVSFDGARAAGAAVREWLDGLDIHLQPSFQEGLPRATIEAMSRGVACIGSTCGGLPELLPADRTHAPGDVAGLAASLLRLVRDPAAIAEASRDGLAISQNYRREVLRARRDEVFRRLREAADRRLREPS